MRIKASIYILILSMLAGCSCAEKKPVNNDSGLTLLKLNKTEVSVEIASTPKQRSRGLMYRETLPQDRGMVFVYPEDYLPAFWMKNTLIPLSIAFINSKGIIIDIQDMEPKTLDPHSPPSKVRYALEVNKGWFEKHGIKTGDSVEGLP